MPVGTGGLYSPWGCKESDTTERLSPHTEHIYICSICIYSSLPCSSVRQILQARILEWVVMHSCRVSSWPRDWTQSPTLQADSLPSEPPGKPIYTYILRLVSELLLLLLLSRFSPVQLCVTPPGSPVPGILQARTMEWVAISFSNAWKWKVKVKWLSFVRLLATPWTTAHQAPLSMGFSRQGYWSGVPLPSSQ